MAEIPIFPNHYGQDKWTYSFEYFLIAGEGAGGHIWLDSRLYHSDADIQAIAADIADGRNLGIFETSIKKLRDTVYILYMVYIVYTERLEKNYL